MSIQFGAWNFDGKPIEPAFLEKVRSVVGPYGPDGSGSYIGDGIAILLHAFHTNAESCREKQPLTMTSGAVITWDGCLDNRSELIVELGGAVGVNTDVDIVAACYVRWGTGSFAKLKGDWALAIWNPSTRSILLAKDFLGSRHLYYMVEENRVTWCSLLEPLTRFSRSLALSEEYLAGCLGFFPAAHLTPYVGIHAVPPTCFVELKPDTCKITTHFAFDPAKRIRHGTDSEYEEHFRVVFREAVRRKLRSHQPILAELSGGMDSSSIVCMADTLLQDKGGPRLDTVSYFDDTEPNWNERGFFEKVEAQRGRTGYHINVGDRELFNLESFGDYFASTPAWRRSNDQLYKQFSSFVADGGYRVVLSGVGGDEVLGGVPTPTPELEDHLARGQLRICAHQLKVWALYQRRPWLHLLFEALRGFFPPSIVGVPRRRGPAAWVNPRFASNNLNALQGYEKRIKLGGALPTFQENLAALAFLNRQMAWSAMPSNPCYVKRYPYLDRDLLEFVYAIPREQLVRPGQRRSLMRRALVGVLPEELLNRKRKAYVSRSINVAISREWSAVGEVSRNMVSHTLGLIDQSKLAEVLHQVRSGSQPAGVPLLRTIALELWLRDLQKLGFLAGPNTQPDSGAQAVPDLAADTA